MNGTSHFEGTDSNGRSFVVDVDDNAEPGAGSDTLSVTGFDQNGVLYENAQPLSRGNIQNHGFACQ